MSDDFLAQAAKGDREAIALCRDRFLGCCHDQDCTVPMAELMASAEMFGRLAAAHGQPDDEITLAAILLFRAGGLHEDGNPERADLYTAEAFALFDRIAAADDISGVIVLMRLISGLADEGEEYAALVVDRLMASLPPQKAALVCAEVRNVKCFDHVFAR